jgi:hypothetical protein
MTNLLREVSAAEVADERSFASYAHQVLGTKYPNIKEMVTLKTRTKQFFVEQPRADWSTLVQTVSYLRAIRKRVDFPWAVLNFVPFAFRDGFLPELDPRNNEQPDPSVEAEVAFILSQETDEWWVGALTLATEVAARRTLVRMWRNRV